jgi:hypothetical protein
MRKKFDKSFLLLDEYKKKGGHNQEEKKIPRKGGLNRLVLSDRNNLKSFFFEIKGIK